MRVEVIAVDPFIDEQNSSNGQHVPDTLRPFLFDGLRELQTYAIIDAAKVVNLPEMLDTSGLPHQCLFKGKALEDLGAVAPWVVQLEEEDSFTRHLFTQGDAPWHLWDCHAVLYVRSSTTLAEMCRHFRKFTRIRDLQGKWYYFRFWERDTFLTLHDSSLVRNDMSVVCFCRVGGRWVAKVGIPTC